MKRNKPTWNHALIDSNKTDKCPPLVKQECWNSGQIAGLIMKKRFCDWNVFSHRYWTIEEFRVLPLPMIICNSPILRNPSAIPRRNRHHPKTVSAQSDIHDT